jgi:hypothetical protein
MANVVATVTSDAQALSSTVLAKLQALEQVVTTAIPDGEKLLADATNDVIQATAAVGGIAASAVTEATAAVNAASSGNFTGAAVDVAGIVNPVSTLFQAVFNFFKGVKEGLAGQAAPAGASGAEQAGDTLGQDGETFINAVEDTFTGKTPPAPANPSGAVGGS